MKLQNMAVVFIIIVLPITLILSAYIQSQIDTAQLVLSYDTKLLDATNDAMRAFELNTNNDDFATIGDSKRRDIEASVTTFTNNLAMNLGVGGYSKKYIEPYLPAVLVTLYDGYYIYTPTPYKKGEQKKQDDGSITTEYENGGNEIYDNVLKPYVYYSARFVSAGIDVVVNYSLDNYVSIVGTVNSTPVHMSGYFYASESELTSKIRSTNIELSEDILLVDNNGNQSLANFKYRRNPTSGKKEYWDSAIGRYFYYDNGSKTYLYGENDATYSVDDNINLYIQTSRKFLSEINRLGLNNLKASQIIDQYGNSMYPDSTGTGNLYAFKGNTEDPYSDFNALRKQVIKDSVQTNLNAAITSYSRHSQAGGTTYNFKMPKLTDNEWETVLNNVSIVTFLQGLPAGTKTYNNYAIAVSANNSEYIDPNMIFLVDKNNVYHRPGCEKLTDTTLNTTKPAFRSIDFSIVTFSREINNVKKGYNFYRHQETACYNCIISNHAKSIMDVNNWDSGFKNARTQVLNVYYQALARERNALYKTTKEFKN